MSNLDEKLQQIIVDSLKEYRPEGKPVAEIVKEIKRALKDAGYATIDKRSYRDELGRVYAQYTIKYPDGSGEFVKAPQFAFMTGQEWYERYEEDLKGVTFPHHCRDDLVNVAGAVERCKNAAKKAADIR
jgi:hypothetical protein